MWHQVKMRKILGKKTLDNNLILLCIVKCLSVTIRFLNWTRFLTPRSFPLFRDVTHQSIVLHGLIIIKNKTWLISSECYCEVPEKAETLPKQLKWSERCTRLSFGNYFRVAITWTFYENLVLRFWEGDPLQFGRLWYGYLRGVLFFCHALGTYVWSFTGRRKRQRQAEKENIKHYWPRRPFTY